MFRNRLEFAREAFVRAEGLAAAHATAMKNNTAALDRLNEEIQRFEAYVAVQKSAASTDLALISLRERRKNLESSRETLLNLSGDIRERRQAAKENLDSLEDMLRRVSSGYEQPPKGIVAQS